MTYVATHDERTSPAASRALPSTGRLRRSALAALVPGLAKGGGRDIDAEWKPVGECRAEDALRKAAAVASDPLRIDAPRCAAPRPLRRLSACIGIASALWLVLAHPAGAEGTRFEVSNIDRANASQTSDLGSEDVSQMFRTAAHVDAYTGYTVTSVGIAFGDVRSPNSVPRVSIYRTATSSHSERKIADLTPPARLSANSVNTWTSDGVQLEPYTFYDLRVDSAGGQSNRGNRIRQTASRREVSSGVTGWFISDQFRHRGASGGAFWLGTTRSLKIRISGTANPASPPDVASITRRSPSSSPTNADSLVWRVAFSKPVRNVDATDFTASGTTATVAVAAADRVGMTYDVTISGGDLADLEGTATLGFASGHDIEDLDGRALSGTAPTGRSDNSYAVDNTGPAVLHVRARGNAEHGTNADVLVWHATFSEPIVNLDPQNVHFDIDGDWHWRMQARARVRRVTGSVWEISADHRMKFNDIEHLLSQVQGHSHDHDDTDESHSHVGTFTAHVIHDRDTTITDLAGNPLTTELDRPGPGPQRSTPSPSFGTQSVEVDRDVPTLEIGVVHGSTITLGYDEILDADSVPAADAFALRVDGTGVSLEPNTPVRIQGRSVVLRLAEAIAHPQVLRLDYTVPDTNAVQDRAGNEVSGIVNRVISHTDWVPPTERVPTAADATVSTAEDDDHSFAVADFGFNGQLGDQLTSVQVTSLPPAGSGILSFDGTAVADDQLPKLVTAAELEETKLTYSPPANANGAGYATFSYKVKNPTHFSADSYTMTIDVTAVNDPAAGRPTISGNARAGATLSADVSAITDAADGLTKAANGDAGHAFGYRWIRIRGAGATASESVIADATSSTYRLVDADVSGTVRVEVSFTDDDGHEETLTSAAWPSSGSVAGGITAAFEDVPPSHDGLSRFTVRLAFSRDVESLSYRWLREHLLSATGGRVVSARRVTRGENRNWLVTLAPTGTDDVTLRLAALPCGTRYAVCDGGTPLAEDLSVTVAYEEAATETPETEVATFGATLVAGTHSHNGAGGSGKFYLHFSSEPQGLSYRHVAPRALLISGGSASRVKRFPAGQNRVWEVIVAPEGNSDIGVALKTTTDCETGICTAAGAMFASDSTLTIPGPSLFSVADAMVEEAEGAALVFTVTLSRARYHHASWVSYATADGTATAGSDYTATSGTLRFAAGVTTRTVRVKVLDDAHDEGDETLTLTLSSSVPAGYLRIGDGVATGTISNSDALPKDWIARFGRTVGEQVLDAVESRMRSNRTLRVDISFAGEDMSWRSGTDPGTGSMACVAGGVGAEDCPASVALPGMTRPEPGTPSSRPQSDVAAHDRRPWMDAARDEVPDSTGRAPRQTEQAFAALAPAGWKRGAGEEYAAGLRTRTFGDRELLFGSSFNVTAETGGPAAGTVSVWGRGAVTSFDGRAGDLTVDGEVASALLGADWNRGRALAGLIVGYSTGDGGYRAPAGSGTVASTLTGLYPWGRYALTEQFEVWGAAGYGEGTLTLEPDGPAGESKAAIRTDMDLWMAAVGLRGTILEGGPGGVTLTAKTDAMAVETSTDAVPGDLAASQAGVTRLRFGLDVTLPLALADGSMLTPSMEIGVRHDGGDAETGHGADVGASVAWHDPRRGINAELRGRGLLAHEAKGFRQRGLSGSLGWNPVAGNRGPSLSLVQTIGGPSSGGADALLRRVTLEGLAASDDGPGDGTDDLRARRLEARFGYGFLVFGDGFVVTPEAGVGLSNTGRDYRLGWQLVRLAQGAGFPGSSFELSMDATRREGAASSHAPLEHAVGLRLTSRF